MDTRGEENEQKMCKWYESSDMMSLCKIKKKEGKMIILRVFFSFSEDLNKTERGFFCLHRKLTYFCFRFEYATAAGKLQHWKVVE